jgi:hypothetical protein
LALLNRKYKHKRDQKPGFDKWSTAQENELQKLNAGEIASERHTIIFGKALEAQNEFLATKLDTAGPDRRKDVLSQVLKKVDRKERKHYLDLLALEEEEDQTLEESSLSSVESNDGHEGDSRSKDGSDGDITNLSSNVSNKDSDNVDDSEGEDASSSDEAPGYVSPDPDECSRTGDSEASTGVAGSGSLQIMDKPARSISVSSNSTISKSKRVLEDADKDEWGGGDSSDSDTSKNEESEGAEDASSSNDAGYVTPDLDAECSSTDGNEAPTGVAGSGSLQIMHKPPCSIKDLEEKKQKANAMNELVDKLVEAVHRTYLRKQDLVILLQSRGIELPLDSEPRKVFMEHWDKVKNLPAIWHRMPWTEKDEAELNALQK